MADDRSYPVVRLRDADERPFVRLRDMAMPDRKLVL